MRSPFLRFAAVFIVVVLAAFGGVLYFTGRLPMPFRSAPATAPSASMAPLPSIAPSSSAPAATAPVTPQPLDNPPDVSGMNYPEVSVPGSDLPAPSPPMSTSSVSAPAASAAAQNSDYVAEISSRPLVMPIAGVPARAIADTFNDARGGGKHEATDIMAPRGTPVHAIAEGNIVKLFTSKKGGLTIYQFDNAQKYSFYYAHLDKYAAGVKEGMLVRPGQVIGYVGSTGDADAANPHLHFAISLLDPDKKYWKGTELNPYPILEKLAAAGT